MKTTIRAALLALPLALTACGSSDDTQAATATARAEPRATSTTEGSGTEGPGGAATAPAALPQDPTAMVDPTAVVARVNGHEITAGKVSEEAQRQITLQTQGMPIPAEQMALFEASLRPRVLGNLVDDLILDDAVAAAGIQVEDEQVRTELDRNFEAYLVQANLTREDVAERVLATEGLTLEELLDQQAKEPESRRLMGHAELIRRTYPAETAVSDEDVNATYQQDLEASFTRPEQVRASHILVADREQAEEALDLARTGDIAFADLARQRSTCPSAPQGGDLGFFPREGGMVEPFAAAAFELQPGEISEPVESQFGFHVIQVTDRTPATVLTLDQVAPMIRSTLEMQKVGQLRDQLLADLREQAKVEYAEGQAPPGAIDPHAGHGHAPGEGH